MAITSPTDFIWVVRRSLAVGNFLEGEARHLGHHIVDRGLERGRRGAAGDVVLQFVERVADGQLGRHLGDRETGRLRGQRGRTRHARIHLDDDHAAVVRIDGELHVGTAGIDADLAQHRDAGVAHDLVFLVGQRLRRRDGDRVAGMHAHRIEVLDRADDDAVVLACRAPPPSRILSSRAAIPRSAVPWSARLPGRACRSRRILPGCRRCRRRCRPW